MDEIRCCEIKGMDMNELRAAIDRLKKVLTACTSLWDVLEAFMGKGMWTADEFRDLLVDVLMQAESKWWSNHPTIREDLESINDELLANMGFIRLPKDKDSIPIHVGDRLQYVNDGKFGMCQVWCMSLDMDSDGWEICDVYDHRYPADCVRHYEPTVKNLLVEFQTKSCDYYNECDQSDSANDMAALVEEYADKLREVMDA